jgi:hypothetical protein
MYTVPNTPQKSNSQSLKTTSEPRHQSAAQQASLVSGAYFDGMEYQFVDRDPVVELHVHADLLKAVARRLPGRVERKQYGGGKRGAIDRFSRASRKRMLELLASIRHDGTMLFLTMTYPDDKVTDDADVYKAQFEAFRRRFEREHPEAFAVWRLELQDRKSGVHRGKIVPHWHLLVFTHDTRDKTLYDDYEPFTQVFHAWARDAWVEIVDSDDKNHRKHGVRTDRVKSRRHAYHYMSKYMTKEDDYRAHIGRRWGRIGSIDTSVSHVAELTAREYVHFKRLVRCWMKARGGSTRDYSRIVARMKPFHGMSVFGLGDESSKDRRFTGWRKTTVLRLIEHAQRLATAELFAGCDG